MNLSPLPKLAFLDNNGRPLVGGKLFTYASGTSTKVATYVDADGSQQNTNPIILDYRGECDCWLEVGQSYTFVLSPPNDTDPPTRPIWTANDINPSALSAFGNFADDVGSTNAYRVDDAIQVPGYSNGLFVSVLIANTNTGASTLDYDGLGPKNIQLTNGSPLIGGELVAGGVYLFEYIAPNWQLLNSSAATAAILQEGRSSPNPLLDWFTDLFTVTQCQGPGEAQVQEDIEDVFDVTFAGLVSTVPFYVAPWGNDLNSGGSWSQAFATVAQGLRSTVSMGTLYIWPGIYEPSDARYTDTYSTHPKKVVAPYGNVILAYSGDDISAATWTPNGMYPDIWQTTLVTTRWPIRILNSETIDQYGLAMPMPLQGSLGESSAVALARLDVSAYGWWYDTGTQILYVRNGVENVETVSKIRLQAVYGLAGSGDNLFQLNATITFWKGITFWAYPFIQNIMGEITPQGWFKACTMGYAAGNGFTVLGGFSYTQDCRSYRSTADGANYNSSNGVLCQGIEINFESQLAGDIATFGSGLTQPFNPVSTTQNKNGSSNHDSYCVRVNGNYTDAYGPVVADTTGSVNWNLGVKSGYCFVTPGGFRDGFYSSGLSYLDGCSAGPGVDFGIHSDAGTIRVYNTFGTQSVTSGGTIAQYTPPA